MPWGSEVEIEIRNRIWIACAAYAYEFEANPIISDAKFDKLALQIRPEMETGNEVMDEFFREKFESHTGAWIHDHPKKQGLARITELIREHRNRQKEGDSNV